MCDKGTCGNGQSLPSSTYSSSFMANHTSSVNSVNGNSKEDGDDNNNYYNDDCKVEKVSQQLVASTDVEREG